MEMIETVFLTPHPIPIEFSSLANKHELQLSTTYVICDEGPRAASQSAESGELHQYRKLASANLPFRQKKVQVFGASNRLLLVGQLAADAGV